ncbi:MAG: hypothetical protein KGS44_11890 [Alphaproteobacteria bacterium]|jgi:hypothetical protein|nr:hypothetical protein [Alphaproteobacteria bacterium]
MLSAPEIAIVTLRAFRARPVELAFIMSSPIAPLGSSPGLVSFGSSQARQRAEGDERAASPTAPIDAAGFSGARKTAVAGQTVLALSASAARQLAVRLNAVAAAAREGRAEDAAALGTQAKTQVSEAIAAGASLMAGQTLRLELGAQPYIVEGADLRFEAPPKGLLSAPGGAETLASAALQAAAQARDLAARWDKAAQWVSAHEGVLAAAERLGRDAARDLDADGARLMALQVRQSMTDSGLAIANSDPQTILALFRS